MKRAVLLFLCACSGVSDPGASSQLGGAWQGTWTSRTGAGGRVTATIEQRGSEIGGTMTFSGSPCLARGKIEAAVFGDSVRGAMRAGEARVDFDATLVAGGLSGTYKATSLGLCTGDTGTLDLER